MPEALQRKPAPITGTSLGSFFDVRSFGAVGDGKAIDTPAVNRAIAAAAAAGGGRVNFSAGTYACYSIHLRSFVTLALQPAATILAATPARQGAVANGYDPAESNDPWEQYQDFGHNHWHNSLIWGEGVHDVAILGPGLIWGKGLSRGLDAEAGLPPADAPGAGDKAIALKNCHNVTLRDFAILAGGHFGILATGVDNLAIDNLIIDTNRDGINIDCSRNVRITGCRVNSPWDDAICLKSSFALGEVRATEKVTISDCYVTGAYQLGAMRDGSFRRFARAIDDNGGRPTGRIKCGTESVGGFRNIAISNCVFEGCRGLAIECVDGGLTEDITVTGLTMRDICNAPLFLRLGARLRAPPGRPAGVLRRVIISDVICDAPANMMPVVVAGIPDHPVEDVLMSDISLRQKGGGSAAMAAVTPPEEVRGYPEPSLFGALPAQGLFIRHARNLSFTDLEIESGAPDARPYCWLENVDDADFTRLGLPAERTAAAFLLIDTQKFRLSGSSGIPDTSLNLVSYREIGRPARKNG